MDCIEVAQERSFDAGSQRTDCGWWLLHVSELRWRACQVPWGSLLGWDGLKKGSSRDPIAPSHLVLISWLSSSQQPHQSLETGDLTVKSAQALTGYFMTWSFYLSYTKPTRLYEIGWFASTWGISESNRRCNTEPLFRLHAAQLGILAVTIDSASRELRLRPRYHHRPL